MNTRVCILHISSKKNGNKEGYIQEFDQSSWDKVKSADSSRKLLFKNSKYYSITLPDDFNENIGYHSKCYSDFTAVPKKVVSGNCDSYVPAEQPHTLRSNVSHTATSTSGVFKAVCIFCNTVRKKRKDSIEYLGRCETDKGEEKIKAAAIKMGRLDILSKVSGIDMKSKEARYHHSCRKDFLNKAREGRERSDKMIDHEKAFNELKLYIQEEIIDTAGGERLTTIHGKYLTLLGDSTYPADSLCTKILKEYKGYIKKHTAATKKGVILYSSELSVDEATRLVFFDHSSLSETALFLRRQIVKMKETITEQTNDYSQEALQNDKQNTPQDLDMFFRILYTGNTKATSEKADRLVNSVCADVIYATTGGRVKPMKHLLMGMGMKSITGSRKVVEILNRYGHSISYVLVEEKETEIATEITEKNVATPDGIERKSGKCTSLAWDNYDEMTQTLSGKGTLHDTVGICYQNQTSECEDQIEPVSASPQRNSLTLHGCTEKRTSKRTIHFQDKNLEPYRKKPKIKVFKYNVKYLPPPPDITRIKYLDHLWVLSTLVTKVPMWVGWNSRLTTDRLPLHTIAYMENITLPPTRLDVVVETMRISQQVARECGEDSAIVHYDLAIAKPALQIQAEEAPKYDNLFICFGPFHTLLAYFGALGHYLDGSGGEEILVDSEVLAGGSLHGFLKGKHYNRCKRIHPLLAAAMQSLHFKSFIAEKGPIPPELAEIIHELNDNASPETLEGLENDEVYTNFMEDYEEHVSKTLNGVHGSTAQYWMNYVQLVNIYLMFNRACRTNNYDLFVYALGEMCQHFFAGNRPNYARWMVRYHLNLVNAETTLPGAREMLQNGALSIRRTSKSFSRTAVDMTLEQTVNRDAASRLTGIAAFSHSPSARTKWTVTKTARSAIVGCLLSGAGLSQQEDITQDLKPYRIEKDNEDLQRVIKQICECMNPFDLPPETALYCLSTGKAVPDDVRDDILQWNAKGKQWLEEFRESCFDNPERFEKPIKRQKIKNFASTAITVKIKSKDAKIKELEGTRDLFGNLLYLSSKEDLDLEKVFEYPLTPVPLSLGSVDGCMNSTNKATLQHKLEEMAETKTEPGITDITLVDASFFLYQIINPGITYGEIAKEILIRLCQMSSTVHLISDRYDTPTIKDHTRSKRREADKQVNVNVQISGPKQHRPKDWKSAIKSGSFKTSLVKFLVQEWAEDKYKGILNGHIVYLTSQEECFRFTVTDGRIFRERVDELECCHQEADTRIMFHLTHALGNDPQATVTVRANDTDIFLLLLYHVNQYHMTHGTMPTVWLDAGLSSDNSRRIISITDIVGDLECSMVNSLLGLHAITGSDYTPAFGHKGKIRPLCLMLKTKQYSETLAKLGEDDVNLDDLTVEIEPWVCALYGKPKLKSVNKARLAVFEIRYKPKHKGDLLQLVKGANPSNFPPSQAALVKHVQRAHLVTSMWKRAWSPNPLRLDPVDYGWKMVDGHFEINWYDCNQVPKSMQDILGQTPLEGDEVDEEEEMAYGENRYGRDESDREDSDTN